MGDRIGVLERRPARPGRHAGRDLQRPARTPSSRAFVGSPAINLLDVQVDLAQGRVHNGALSFGLDAATRETLAPLLPADGRVRLGIRPEDIALVGRGGHRRLDLRRREPRRRDHRGGRGRRPPPARHRAGKDADRLEPAGAHRVRATTTALLRPAVRPQPAPALTPQLAKETTMHIATHNWMRPESIKRTIERMRETGVDALEISGEPDQYDTKEVRKLLADNGRECWGSVTLTLGERNLAATRHGATREDRRLHEARGHDGQGARRPDHHDGAGHGRQGGRRRHARPGMEVAGRRHQGGLRARREGRHPHRHRAAEPLRDLPHQPRRPGARPGRRGRARTAACAWTCST